MSEKEDKASKQWAYGFRTSYIDINNTMAVITKQSPVDNLAPIELTALGETIVY